MFDFCSEDMDFEVLTSSNETMNKTSLENMLENLSDDELNSLEDELNFATFTGLPSQRILSILSALSPLDAGWSQMMANGVTTDLVAAA
ncbi:MAG: hypothetical protein GKR98_17470 [Boseongicola sp.]|nr:MAG: hypothetical protein GKR98_17470 [Boseongicola sp.]